MKFGICNEIFKDWDIEKGLQFAKDTGYNAIEIAPFTLANYVTDISPETRKRIRDYAAKIDLEISAVHWVLVQAEGMYMPHTDPEIRAKTAQYFCDLVDFCGDLGGKAIVVGSPKQRNLLPGVTFEQAWDWAKEVFKPSIARAADRLLSSRIIAASTACSANNGFSILCVISRSLSLTVGGCRTCLHCGGSQYCHEVGSACV